MYLKYIIGRIFVILSVVAFLGLLTSAVKKDNVNVLANDTCPHTGNWTKVEWNDGKSSEEYTAPSGKKIIEVCVKGGQQIKYYTGDGTQVCWEVDFKNSDTMVKISEKNCGGNEKPDISHISYKVANIATATPTATCTARPTRTPTATATNKPTATPTVTPTVTPTTTPTDGPTDNPTATPTETPQGTNEPTNTPEPTATPTTNPDVCPNLDGIQTSLPDEYHFDNAGVKCLKFELGGAPEPAGIGGGDILGTSTQGQVLGASTMAATGVASENIMNLVFGIGSFLTSIGIIRSGKKKS